MCSTLFVFAVLLIGLSSAKRGAKKEAARCVMGHGHHKTRDGNLEIRSPASTDPFGWKLTVTFSKEVERLEIWHAQKVSDDGTTFELKNKEDNRVLRKGQTLSIFFRAHVAKGKWWALSCDDVSFEPLDEEGSGFYLQA